MNINQALDTQDSTETNLVTDHGAAEFYEREPSHRTRVEVAGHSHPGKVRANNEDNFIAVRRYRGRELLASSLPPELFEADDDHAYVLAVADGMGGRNFGEVASLLAMRLGWELGGAEIKWPMRMNEREAEELRPKAEIFFRLIDEALHAEVRAEPRLAGMGTTLTICYSTGPELFVLHVGDSRAYLYRGGTLRRLTHDHNMAQLMVDSGLAAPGSQELVRVRHLLTNVLGGPDDSVSVDVDHVRLAHGDLVLLCTDGLNDMASDDEINRVLGKHPVLDDACRALIDLALYGGGKDNVTVVLARYHFEGAPDQAGQGRSGASA